MMQRYLSAAVVLVILLGPASGAARAENAQTRGQGSSTPVPPPPPAPPAPPGPPPPPGAVRVPVGVRIDWLLTRWQGEKRVASVPYMMVATANSSQTTSLRLGVQVPVATGRPDAALQYQSVGQNISVADIGTVEGNRYALRLMFEESFVYGLTATSQPVIKADSPAIGTYRVDVLVTVRDGQPTLINQATDRVSGETIKLEVTVTAVK